MKILNQTYRDISPEEDTVQKTFVSELPEDTDIREESLIHLVQIIDEDSVNPKYESKKVKMKTFQNKMYEAVQNTLKTAYWDTHLGDAVDGKASHDQDEGNNRPVGSSFKEMVEYLKSKDETKKDTDTTVYAPEEIDESGVDGFVKHLYYDFDVIKRYVVMKDNLLQENISKVSNNIEYLDSYFGHEMKFNTTRRTNVGDIETTETSVNHNKNENDTYCQMVIQEGNRISNEWTTPAAGNLVVYGWLDSTAALNNKAIPSAFCVLEANINSTKENKNWEIISVQPVIPAKNITYVGFNVPVKKNLKIRVRTGFNVGAKSGGYSNENDGYDTLANITANGFKCMVYSSVKYDTSNDTI